MWMGSIPQWWRMRGCWNADAFRICIARENLCWRLYNAPLTVGTAMQINSAAARLLSHSIAPSFSPTQQVFHWTELIRSFCFLFFLLLLAGNVTTICYFSTTSITNFLSSLLFRSFPPIYPRHLCMQLLVNTFNRLHLSDFLLSKQTKTLRLELVSPHNSHLCSRSISLPLSPSCFLSDSLHLSLLQHVVVTSSYQGSQLTDSGSRSLWNEPIREVEKGSSLQRFPLNFTSGNPTNSRPTSRSNFSSAEALQTNVGKADHQLLRRFNEDSKTMCWSTSLNV